MDKESPNIIIFGSILGAMAEPNAWPEFSCIRQDGSLDEKKYDDYMRHFADRGATATRELPFLVPENHQSQGITNYLPYVFRDGKYDLEKFNYVYFHNLNRMAHIANSHGIIFYISVLDRCHQLNMKWSPWNLNHQGIQGFYNADLSYIERWTKKIFHALNGTVWGLEIMNEPRREDFIPLGVRILELAKEWKVFDHRIILGVEYLRYTVGYMKKDLVENQLFGRFSRTVRKKGLRDKKKQFFKIIHGVDENFLEEYKNIQKHSSRFFISDDGVKPKRSAQWWEANLEKFFKARRVKRNKAFSLQFGFEHVYRFFKDDIDGVIGIARAFEKVTGIKLTQ